LAHYSYRKSSEDQVVVVGEKERYEPLCRTCYNRARDSAALKDHI
ncbi:MAG: thymidine kinase, partial [Bacteroidales bacterium]|nr:thymidine kinase [Bacteroidales bacterium]